MYGQQYMESRPRSSPWCFIVLAVLSLLYDLAAMIFSGITAAHTQTLWVKALCSSVLIVGVWAILMHVLGIIIVTEAMPNRRVVSFVQTSYEVQVGLMFAYTLFFAYMLTNTEDNDKELYLIILGVIFVGILILVLECFVYMIKMKPTASPRYLLLSVAYPFAKSPIY